MTSARRSMVVVEHTMDVSGWLRKQLEQASPDLLRAMVQEMAEALRGGEADEFCGAAYGERSPERVNRRDRERGWDTRVGSIELAVPKLREGSYFPDWLLQPRRRPVGGISPDAPSQPTRPLAGWWAGRPETAVT